MSAAFAAVLLLAALAPLAHGAPEAPATAPSQHDLNLAQSHRDDRTNLALYRGNPDVLVLPGLLANRKDKTVTIRAEATALGDDTPIEFFLVPDTSPKDYEALAVCFAKPSDIHKALEFLGMKPGSPVNFGTLRYWPKGERVFMSFAWQDPAGPGKPPVSHRVRAEAMLSDTRTHQALPSAGMVFCGSYSVPLAEDPGRPEYRADWGEPNCVASNYNEPTTVLDLPRQAPQGTVYATQQPNPAYHLAPRQPIEVMLEPEYKDGRKRVRDLTLQVTLPPHAFGTDLSSLHLALSDARGQPLDAGGTTLVHVLAALDKITERGQDPFVTVEWGDTLPIRTLTQFAVLLGSVETQRGIRIEPPGPGQLYYRALLPDERWRDPAMRMGQPWELHVRVQDGRAAGTLVEVRENWDVPDPPRFETKATPVADGQELARALTAHDGDRPRGVLVFIDPGATYGVMMTLLRPALATHNKILVFAEGPPAKP
jgi:hypothetical protein